MSISESPSIKITFSTAQEISDEILGGTIQFCRETGYKQNIPMLTFFWSAFLLNARNELDKNELIEKVINSYIRSLSCVYSKLSEDADMRQSVDEMLHRYWNNISSDFSAIRTGNEIFAFFQIANKLNNQYDTENFRFLKNDPWKSFTQISSAINSRVDCILCQIDNELIIQYKGVLDEFRFTKIHPKANEKTKNKTLESEGTLIKTTINTAQKTLGMAWYKYLIYFGLFAGAVINLIYSIGYMTGAIYMIETNGEVTAKQVYAYYGQALQVVDIMYGIFLIAFSVFAIILRYQLANFEPEAIKFVKIFYSISAVSPFIYAISVAPITSQSIDKNVIISLISGIVILICNIIYFNKRAHLFVGKSAPTELLHTTDGNFAITSLKKTGTENKTELNECLYCRKCGTKLLDDSIFCHKCGTKAIK